MQYYKWDPIQGFYQPAMKLYLGADSSSDRSLGWFKGNYRSIIQSELFEPRLLVMEDLRSSRKQLIISDSAWGFLEKGTCKTMITGGFAPARTTSGPNLFVLKAQRGMAGVTTGSMASDLFVTKDLGCLMFP